MQNQFNQSGVYIILPFKSTYGIPSFEIAQTIFEVFPLPTNNLIQATNHYDIIYLIHIWNVEQAKQNNIQIKFRLNNTSYWNIKGRIIEDVPAHRKVNPISISFKFQIKFIKVVKKYANTGITPKFIPPDKRALSLAEELSYFKSYFENKNEWNNYCTFYLNEDLINYINYHVKSNESLEMEVFLFIFKESKQNLLYYINQFKKDIHSVELSSNKILINYLRDSNTIIMMFQTILNLSDQMDNSTTSKATESRNIKNTFR